MPDIHTEGIKAKEHTDMGVWSQIDRIDQATWEYVPMGIAEDLKNLPRVVDRLFPHGNTDDTSWTTVITLSRRNIRVPEEESYEQPLAA